MRKLLILAAVAAATTVGAQTRCDIIRSGGVTTDAATVATADNKGGPTALPVVSYGYEFDGTNWDRARVFYEDVAQTAGGALDMCGTVRRDTAASSADTSGDNATLNTDANGNLWVTGTVIEDAAETTGGELVAVGAVVRSTVVGSSATNNDNATLNVSTLGALYVQVTGAASMTSGSENIEAAGTAEQLGSNACKQVILSCPAANTSNCYFRADAGNGITGGIVVPKSTSFTLPVNNTSVVWVDAGTTNDDVNWVCVN